MILLTLSYTRNADLSVMLFLSLPDGDDGTLRVANKLSAYRSDEGAYTVWPTARPLGRSPRILREPWAALLRLFKLYDLE